MAARFCALLLAAISVVAASSNVASARPFRGVNVVLFLADDRGWNDVGYHGSVIDTPNIDRLAEEGVVLDRFYVSPYCSPTRAAILTGRSPIHVGIWNHVVGYTPVGIPSDEYTLAERLHDAGYQTAIIGKWHLGIMRSEHLPNLQGFDYFFGTLNGGIDYFTHIRTVLWQEYDLQRNGKSVVEEGYFTRLVAEEASRYIENRDPHRPFFLYVPFQSPHGPNQAPEATVEKYAHVSRPARRLHAAMVDEMDRAIGAVLETLREECLRSDTIVLFLSDNGGTTGFFGGDNRPLRGNKGTVFEGGIRVPAVIHWPAGLPAGNLDRQVAAHHDLFATLEALADLPIRAPAESMNLAPILRGAPDRERTLFLSSGVAGQRAVIDDRWKLIVQDDGPPLLFDLEADPLETTDRAGLHRERVEELAVRIERNEALHPDFGVGVTPVTPGTMIQSDTVAYLEDPDVLEAYLRSQFESEPKGKSNPAHGRGFRKPGPGCQAPGPKFQPTPKSHPALPPRL